MGVARCGLSLTPPCDVRTCAWVASGNSHVLYDARGIIKLNNCALFPPITAPRGIPQDNSPRNPQRPINHAWTSIGQSTATSTALAADFPLRASTRRSTGFPAKKRTRRSSLFPGTLSLACTPEACPRQRNARPCSAHGRFASTKMKNGPGIPGGVIFRAMNRYTSRSSPSSTSPRLPAASSQSPSKIFTGDIRQPSR